VTGFIWKALEFKKKKLKVFKHKFFLYHVKKKHPKAFENIIFLLGRKQLNRFPENPVKTVFFSYSNT